MRDLKVHYDFIHNFKHNAFSSLLFIFLELVVAMKWFSFDNFIYSKLFAVFFKCHTRYFVILNNFKSI